MELSLLKVFCSFLKIGRVVVNEHKQFVHKNTMSQKVYCATLKIMSFATIFLEVLLWCDIILFIK